MRGTELSQKQLEAAEQFVLLMRAEDNTAHPSAEQMVRFNWDSLIRLVALYGSLRGKAVAEGNDPDEPGVIYKIGIDVGEEK